MEAYSKSGPKTPSAAARERERERLRTMQRLLAIETEQEFIEELRVHAKVDAKHPGYLEMIRIWREHHP
jgi:hypothetical protein